MISNSDTLAGGNAIPPATKFFFFSSSSQSKTQQYYPNSTANQTDRSNLIEQLDSKQADREVAA